jgi:hypothetical protein
VSISVGISPGFSGIENDMVFIRLLYQEAVAEERAEPERNMRTEGRSGFPGRIKKALKPRKGGGPNHPAIHPDVTGSNKRLT